MAQTSNLKSAAITQLDTIPILAPTQGEGGFAYLEEVDGFVTTLAADTTTSTYKLVRVPTNAKVKVVLLDSAALTGASANVGIYYSDAYATSGIVDGTPPSLSGLVVPGIGATLFASALSVATANAHLDITNQSGNYPINNRNQLLWQAAGLTADPGGYFDIVAQPSVQGTAGGVLGVTVEFAR